MVLVEGWAWSFQEQWFYDSAWKAREEKWAESEEQPVYEDKGMAKHQGLSYAQNGYEVREELPWLPHLLSHHGKHCSPPGSMVSGMLAPFPACCTQLPPAAAKCQSQLLANRFG